MWGAACVVALLLLPLVHSDAATETAKYTLRKLPLSCCTQVPHLLQKVVEVELGGHQALQCLLSLVLLQQGVRSDVQGEKARAMQRYASRHEQMASEAVQQCIMCPC